jgi:hypothetical protein
MCRNANGVCASGGSFLIQLDSEELVERERERVGSRCRRRSSGGEEIE